jgi:hypothetical protein
MDIYGVGGCSAVLQSDHRQLRVTVDSDEERTDKRPQKLLPGRLRKIQKFLVGVVEEFRLCALHCILQANSQGKRQVALHQAVLEGCIA